MFDLVEFWGMNEKVVGSFETRDEALQKAKEMGLIGECNLTWGEDGAFILHDGKKEIV